MLILGWYFNNRPLALPFLFSILNYPPIDRCVTTAFEKMSLKFGELGSNLGPETGYPD
jgi:hypothetical protein